MAALTGRVVLITGAGSGLGRAMALAAAARGAAIAALDISDAGLTTLAHDISTRSATITADVRDRDALAAAVAALASQLGPIDVAIANAGIGFESSALNFRAVDIEEHVRVNLLGVINTIGAVLPEMLTRGRGHLVAISSIASFRGLPLMTGYCVSKAGVNSLMDGLRVELRPRGIHVTTICPAWVRTPLTANLHIPARDLMEVDAAAKAVLDAVESEKSFVAFPRRIVWRTRFLTMLPRRMADRLIARVMSRYRPR